MESRDAQQCLKSCSREKCSVNLLPSTVCIESTLDAQPQPNVGVCVLDRHIIKERSAVIKKKQVIR